MAIDISTYLPVTSTVENVLADTKVFAGLGLSTNPLIPTSNPVLRFSSLAAVGAALGTSSTEYTAADKYFKTSNTALSTPAYIYFGKYVVAAIAPYLRSGVISSVATTLATLKTITTGQISVSVNGVVYPTATINLSAATSISNACSLLQTAILAANAALVTASFTVTFDAVQNQFVLAIPGTGVIKTMGYAASTGSPALATVMQLTLATNAVLSQGADAADAPTNMNNLLPYFTDQFTLAFVDTMAGLQTPSVQLELSGWVDSQGDRFNFFCWSSEAAIESQTDTTSIWYLVGQEGYNNTSFFDEVIYGTSDRAFAAMGIFASVDFTQPNSALTLAFKTQTGLLPSVLLTSIALILDGPSPANPAGKSINYYGNIGISGSTVQVNWFYGGYTSGKWTYIDNQVAQVWIAFRFQVALANLFSALPQIPNDPDGYGMVRNALTDEANDAITAGIIATGVVFSNATVQQLKTQFGVNAQELTNNGYIILNMATSQAQRQLREVAPWFFIYVKGSAIQYLPINTVTYY